MLVVSDTSPLSNLAIIGRLDLLRGRAAAVETRFIAAPCLRRTAIFATGFRDSMRSAGSVIPENSSLGIKQLHLNRRIASKHRFILRCLIR